MSIYSFFRSLICSEEASSAVEYAVMLALIIVGCILTITALGEASYYALWDAVEALE